MNCSNCGAVMEETARFCGECGTPLSQAKTQYQEPVKRQQDSESPDQQEVPSPQQPVQTQPSQGQQSFQAGPQQAQPQAQQMANATVAVQRNPNEYTERVKKTSKQFFQFAKQALKNPMTTSRHTTERDKVNGFIAHVLFAFLLPLYSYLMASGMSSGLVDLPFGATVLKPFFYILLFLAVFVTVNLAVGKMIKADVTFMSVMAKFGALNVVPVTALLLSILCSLLSFTIFSVLLCGTAVLLFAVSNVSLLFSINEEKRTSTGLDVYYGLILTNIVMVIFFAIVGVTVMRRVASQLLDVLTLF